jgi:hypothetical protein
VSDIHGLMGWWYTTGPGALHQVVACPQDTPSCVLVENAAGQRFWAPTELVKGIATAPESRLFIGVFPGGIVYADRARETFGDYERLAFLPFGTLEFQWSKNPCPASLRALVVADAAGVQARRGEDFQVSTSGQTVRLGEMAA